MEIECRDRVKLGLARPSACNVCVSIFGLPCTQKSEDQTHENLDQESMMADFCTGTEIDACRC